MTDLLEIRNWKEFQHYSDRCPPWIKLHRVLLTSRDWVKASDDSRCLMVASMLLAPATPETTPLRGFIPNDPEYIERAAYLNGPCNFKPLIDSGFLVPLADASTLLADATTEGKQKEYRKEREGTRAPAREESLPSPGQASMIQDIAAERGTTVEAALAACGLAALTRSNVSTVKAWLRSQPMPDEAELERKRKRAERAELKRRCLEVCDSDGAQVAREWIAGATADDKARSCLLAAVKTWEVGR